ncbi:MAG: ADP-ribosylglycohydrolase family protein [Kiritimatiellae bacterium]|nr:ADP-ribosylglycohydrolase family protein [Kiritimatiellia bacterium]
MSTQRWTRGNGWIWIALLLTSVAGAGERRLPVREYRQRMEAGWLGQMAGVAWGAPTEFKWKDAIIPADRVPTWSDAMINDAFGQDDLYVEMTFLEVMEKFGIEPPIREAGIAFANSEYRLWCANRAGRNNLRRGIAPPDSGHPAFNPCPNDIDYQIEADFSGLVAPGLSQAAVDLGWLFGRLMNYGDGVYAGQFVGAMYAEAFFQREPRRIVEAALAAIPAGSDYAAMVRDVLAWHAESPRDWQTTWKRCQQKWRLGKERGSNGGIDARINGAYVLVGLLYGESDPANTIMISMRCGQDSDCNPSTAMGVLGVALGLEGLPAGWRTALDRSRTFAHTPYTFDRLLDACERLARQIVVRHGGRIENGPEGDVLVVPDAPPRPSPLLRSWEPDAPTGAVFTPEELDRLRFAAVRNPLRGWTIRDCGPEMDPGFRLEWAGRRGVWVTHPLDSRTGCSLIREVELPPAGGRLVIEVGHHPKGDFELIVRVAGEEVLRTVVGDATATEGWLATSLDLARWAGRRVTIEVVNHPNNWSHEAAYWSRLQIEL